MKTFLLPSILLLSGASFAGNGAYPIVDTSQEICYNDRVAIREPNHGESWSGQDAQISGNQPSYRVNGNGTVTDQVTGLMWQQNPGEKQTLTQAIVGAESCRLGGFDDWRVPTIKELYSLIQFNGLDPMVMGKDTKGLVPFIDKTAFEFRYGDPQRGERIIDSQYGSSTLYRGTTMWGNETLFGVNFADGRIKGYGLSHPRTRQTKTFFFLYVRGNQDYGKNKFVENGNGTVTDEATQLMWTQYDNGFLSSKPDGMTWKEALAWAEDMELAGHSDWRLPNIKELQSLVEYTRSPQATNSAAIDPVFHLSVIEDPAGKQIHPALWSSTTHPSTRGGSTACYINFGESQGWMYSPVLRKKMLLDVHGAGAQRSDPKAGDASLFPYGRGPQGDVITIRNHVILVRDVSVTVAGH